MSREELAKRVKAPEDVLEQALADAEGAILDLCNRTCITPTMQPLLISLASVYAYRILAAGEDSRSEGEVSVHYSYSKEIPEDLMKRIISKRKLKQAGVANAVKKS